MSTSIGLAYTCPEGVDVSHAIHLIAKKHGYGLLPFRNAEPDVKSGIEHTCQSLGWENIVLLQSPVVDSVALAPGIDNELTLLETENTPPPFFAFLLDVCEAVESRVSTLGIFFAAEWQANYRARYSYGSVDKLIGLLSMPGHWYTRYFVPETKRLQDSDETPFVFELSFAKCED